MKIVESVALVTGANRGLGLRPKELERYFGSL
jgi:hypothetical protein